MTTRATGRSVLLIFALLALPYTGSAQQAEPAFQVGAQVVAARSGQFDRSDVGLGVRGTWHPSTVLGLEGEFNLYPGDFPDRQAFSGRRVEALFGGTVGPRIGRLRPFARARAGVLRFGAAPEPLGCIAIFPPPLRCTLAAGRNLFTLDLGGGLEWLATAPTFWRVDVGDRLVRYPGPALDNNFRSRDGFFGHDFRLAAGGGFRF